MAQLSIPWEPVTTLTPAVISGDSSNTSTGTAREITEADGSKFTWRKPTLVWVCAENQKAGTIDPVASNILPIEKIALGMKAFRAVKMTEAAAAADAAVSVSGTAVPRFVLIDHNSGTTEVVEENKRKSTKLTATTLYDAMVKVAALTYVEKLDVTVKSHIKSLTELDKLTQALGVLTAKLERAKESKNAKTQASIPGIEAEIAANNAATAELLKKQTGMWELSPRKPKAL